MKERLAAVVVSAAIPCAMAGADVLVEFSLYTDMEWTEENRVADVWMTIEGVDLMGHLPEGTTTRFADVLILTSWGTGDHFAGEVTSWLSEDEGWGDLGFDLGESFELLGGGQNSMSMEWLESWDSDGNFEGFSYGLATWEGGFADYVGVDQLYLGWPINETTIPAPGAVALLSLTAMVRRRRRPA
ncbi:MAG: hypothetical protein MK101_01520 [Phycisphaerales bacterium]|nr:hypothetical protein [Phycisphaerales bacterium]